MRHHKDQATQLKFGKRIAQLREEKGMTQEKLAENAGLDRMTIALIETGRRWPRLETLKKIVAALDTSLEQLFKGL